VIDFIQKRKEKLKNNVEDEETKSDSKENR
jgi:hypothetical protein